MTEEQKAERRQLIRATRPSSRHETRRHWVRDFLARRSTPKGVLRYCADGLTGEGHRWLLVRWYNGAAIQAETAARAKPSPSPPTPPATPGYRWPSSPRPPARSKPPLGRSPGGTPTPPPSYGSASSPPKATNWPRSSSTSSTTPPHRRRPGVDLMTNPTWPVYGGAPLAGAALPGVARHTRSHRTGGRRVHRRGTTRADRPVRPPRRNPGHRPHAGAGWSTATRRGTT